MGGQRDDGQNRVGRSEVRSYGADSHQSHIEVKSYYGPEDVKDIFYGADRH